MIARSRSSSLFSDRTVASRPARIAVPVSLEGADQAGPEPRQGDVGVDLVEADLDVPPADPPAAGDVRRVVPAGEQLADPPQQRALEPVDLGLAAGDDLAGLGVALDLGVEVVDQRFQGRPEPSRRVGDTPRVLLGPADVGLELLVSPEDPPVIHRDRSGPHRGHEKTHDPPGAESWAISNPARIARRERPTIRFVRSILGRG